MNSAKLLAKITEKWPVKVLSLAAAVIISVFYRMNTLETRSFTVPLRIELNETMIPASSVAGTVRISLRGEANGIMPIHENDIEAFIDLSKYTSEGSYRVPVQIRKTGSALGVEPLEISVLPIEISLLLGEKASRSIPVFPVFHGAIAEGFELTAQSIIPESVTAEGPRSILENLYEFYTGTIDLDMRYGDFSIMANIINNNPLVTIHGNRMIEYRGTIRRIMRRTEDSGSPPDLQTGVSGQ